jgi:hypothetical protein
MPRCAADKADGSPCERIVGASQRFCYSHHPDSASRRSEAAARAARAKGGPALEREPARCRRELWRVAAAVESGDLSPKSGAVIGQLLNTVLRSLSVESALRERAEVEDRLRRLEEARRWGT